MPCPYGGFWRVPPLYPTPVSVAIGGTIGGGTHPPAPSPSQSDREGVWIPAFAGMTGRGEGLDCGLRRNDERLGAMKSRQY